MFAILYEQHLRACLRPPTPIPLGLKDRMVKVQTTLVSSPRNQRESPPGQRLSGPLHARNWSRIPAQRHSTECQGNQSLPALCHPSTVLVLSSGPSTLSPPLRTVP